jgi:hypothetical protein
MTLGGKLGIYIDYLLGGQIWKTIHEKSQRTLDSVVQLNALGFANAPPTSAHGDTYIVGTAPTGAFAGQAPGAVATYHSTLGGWEFYTPLKGWRGYIASDMYYYNGSAWGLEANLPGASAVAAITAQNVAASVAGAAVANHAASGDHDARYVNVAGDAMGGHLSLPANPSLDHAVRKDFLLSKFSTLTTAGVLDWNDISNTQPGCGPTLLYGSHANGPGTGLLYYFVFCFEYGGLNGTQQITQLAIPYGGNPLAADSRIRIRGRYLGAWTSWYTV